MKKKMAVIGSANDTVYSNENLLKIQRHFKIVQFVDGKIFCLHYKNRTPFFFQIHEIIQSK